MAILRCEPCRPHEFQDATYGYRMRVKNYLPPKSKGGSPSYVCTVCGERREFEAPKAKAAKAARGVK